MTLHHKSVLIVDPSSAFALDLRSRLLPLGVHVHVVSSPAKAIVIARRKRIDMAVFDYAMECATELAAALNEQNIPIVYTTPLAEHPDCAPVSASAG